MFIDVIADILPVYLCAWNYVHLHYVTLYVTSIVLPPFISAAFPSYIIQSSWNNISGAPYRHYMNISCYRRGSYHYIPHVSQRGSCQILQITSAHAPGMPGTFSPPPRVSHPDMHHGTCVTHMPWCMPGSLTSGFLLSRRGETFPAFPAYAQPAILRIG